MIYTLINFLIGLYVFAESFTAINEMEKVRITRIFHEFANPYTLKYWGIGIYGLCLIYFCKDIEGYYILLTLPAILCVVQRTTYRVSRSYYAYLILLAIDHLKDKVRAK